MRSKTAPGELELVESFLNTNDIEAGADEFSDAASLGGWFSDRELIAAGDLVTEADLARALEFREALRELAHRNHGADFDDQKAVAILNQVTEIAPLRVQFTRGGATLTPQGTGVTRALARLVGIVFAAMADGTWRRVKVCLKDSCRWAFYDHSKNRSRSWCSMAVCGNRMKAQTYREKSIKGR